MNKRVDHEYDMMGKKRVYAARLLDNRCKQAYIETNRRLNSFVKISKKIATHLCFIF